jgi:hypothetical protein
VANSSTDWSALQRAIAGEVVLPRSRGYELARKPAIANFHDARPQAVALCPGASDVAEVISFAAASGLPTGARSGGHCFAGRSSTGGIVIDVATVGAGTRLGAEMVLADGRVVQCDGHASRICSGRFVGPVVAVSGWSRRWCSRRSRLMP